MSIDLHELIINPGRRIPFSCELPQDRLEQPSILCFSDPVTGSGEIRNEAGLLVLSGRIRTRMVCICDRCANEFEQSVVIPVELTLATELEDEENPDFFLLSDEKLDVEDVLSDCFILELDSSFLCREDCKGLCDRCGANLNDGPCSCKKEMDPRLAVLEQLLDDKD